MAGDDREPIGRKGRPSRPAKQKVTRRRVREEDYDDDYDDDDYEDEKPMPRKGKGKGGKPPRRKRAWLWLLIKIGGRLRGVDCRLWRLPRSENPQPHRR